MADEEFREVRYSAQDGLELAARIYGYRDGHTWPVVCLPGLTRNARDFHGLATFLSGPKGGRRQVIAFDYRGRGKSAYDGNWQNYNVATEAGDIIAGLTALGIEHAAFVGTSRGGILLHLLAGMRPAAMKAVVLNDIGPEIGGAGLAQIKAYLEQTPKPANFEQAVEVQKRVHGKAFPALSDADWQRHARAIYRDENGRPVPDYDPNLLNLVKDWDLNEAVPSMWPQFDGLGKIPMLVLRGEHSLLLMAETLERMKKRRTDLEAITVPGQGHAPLLDGHGLPEAISAFISKAESASKTPA